MEWTRLWMRRLRRIHPFSVLLDQVDQPLHRFSFRDVELHRCLADVEVDLVRRTADITEIGIGHFAGPIDDAAHDGDADTL